MWRTKLFTNCNGHGQSGWSPIGCEGVYFHAICKNRVSVSGRPPIRCEGVHTNLNIPSPLLTTLNCSLILSVIQLYIYYVYTCIFHVWQYDILHVKITKSPSCALSASCTLRVGSKRWTVVFCRKKTRKSCRNPSTVEFPASQIVVDGALPCALNPSVVPQHRLLWFLAIQSTPSYQYGYGSTLGAATREKATKNDYKILLKKQRHFLVWLLTHQRKFSLKTSELQTIVMVTWLAFPPSCQPHRHVNHPWSSKLSS